MGNPSLDDLAEIMPVVARSLQDILDYEGDVEEDLLLNFEVIFFAVNPALNPTTCSPGLNFLRYIKCMCCLITVISFKQFLIPFQQFLNNYQQ